MERTTKPMLAALQRELLVGSYVYEPKWGGLQRLAFVEGGEVDLRSRHGRPLGRVLQRHGLEPAPARASVCRGRPSSERTWRDRRADFFSVEELTLTGSFATSCCS